MNAKNISILTIITLLAVIAAVMLTQQKPTTQPQQKFFPNLMSVVNDVTEINVRTKDDSVTLILGDGQWLFKEQHNYPVASDKINMLLLGVADLTAVEAKTSNPDLYSKIGVEDISEPEAKSTLLTLKKGEGETVASLIIGNDRVAKIDANRSEIYVRKPDNKQAWLTLGKLRIEKEPRNWLLLEIINIDYNKIQQVRITHPDGDSFVVLKDTPKDDNYKLADLPKNAKVKAANMLESIATTLTSLKLDDVMAATEFEFDDKASTRAVFITFDGLEVTMTTTEKDGKHYAKLAAEFNPDAVFVEAAEGEKSADVQPKVDAKKQAEILNAKLKGWVYELSNYKVDNLLKKRDDFIELEEKPAVSETSAIEGSGGLPVVEVDEMLEELLNPFNVLPAIDSDE